MSPLTNEERAKLRGPLTVLQIIVASLLLGVAGFTCYAVYSQLQNGRALPQLAAPLQIMQVIAMAFAAGAAVIAFVVAPFIPAPKAENDKTDPREIAIFTAATALQTRTIFACAFLEGAAFFNGIFVQTDFSLPNLAMVGVLLILLALHFPLAGWYYGKVERLMGVDPFESAYQAKK